MVDQVKNNPGIDLAALAKSRQAGMIDAGSGQTTSERNKEEQKKDTSAGEQKTPLRPAVYRDLPVTEFFFQSEKPDFSFIWKVTHKQVRFEGYFFKTNDVKLANYIKKCYGSMVYEIDKERYEEGVTLRPGGAEPVKSSIIVNRLP